jgi:hypothetical protein
MILAAGKQRNTQILSQSTTMGSCLQMPQLFLALTPFERGRLLQPDRGLGENSFFTEARMRVFRVKGLLPQRLRLQFRVTCTYKVQKCLETIGWIRKKKETFFFGYLQ